MVVFRLPATQRPDTSIFWQLLPSASCQVELSAQLLELGPLATVVATVSLRQSPSGALERLTWIQHSPLLAGSVPMSIPTHSESLAHISLQKSSNRVKLYSDTRPGSDESSSQRKYSELFRVKFKGSHVMLVARYRLS